jgi:anti-sigma factor RsiW
MPMEGERVVAGLHCGEVLADLSAAFDGELNAERARRLEDHARDCENCRRFGAELNVAVLALRRALAEPPSDPGVESRLLERLHTEAAPHD